MLSVKRIGLLLAIFSFSVAGCCETTIKSTLLPDGQVGVPYSYELDAECDNDRWEIVSGDLPPGIAFASDGKFSGTPTQEGAYNLTIGVGSDESLFVTKGFALAVIP
jgi:hypothetical protein